MSREVVLSAGVATAAEVEAHGPAECPDGVELGFRVERNVKVPLAQAPPVHFVVQMDHVAPGYLARISATGAGSREAKERVLSGADCSQLADAVVVAITLALGASEPVPEDTARSEPARSESIPSLPAASTVMPAANTESSGADTGGTPSANEPRSSALRPSLSLSVLAERAPSLPLAPAEVPTLPVEQPTPPQRSLPEAESPSSPVPVTTRASSAGPQPRATRHTARATRTQTEPNQALNAELVLLQRAERAIRSGEPELALSFLDDLDRRYPDTRLAEERTAARVMAGCARHEPGAAAQAELFLRERRGSVYSDRVRALCQIEPSPDAPDGNRNAGH